VTAACTTAFCQGQSAGQDRVERLVRFQHDQTVAYGVVEGDRVVQIEGDLFGARRPTDRSYSLASVKLLVPVEPKTILAAAGNYKDHLGERAPPANPEFFFKPPSCLIADGEPIVLPSGSSDVHYEAELVIVIGRQARNVPKDAALDYVLGVACGNDVSARDWQDGDRQWWRAKGTDTFGPCGPVIVSGLNYDNLRIEGRLNGEVKQRSNTMEHIFGVADMVSFASRHVTLEPGDLIFGGTPGMTSKLSAGDVFEVEIEGVGVLSNPVVGERN
jgi:2-keto-4-pentenoate hydratase/2-oxohepta-3-ene-1,7-dioic acid hydratase in catechol pathway